MVLNSLIQQNIYPYGELLPRQIPGLAFWADASYPKEDGSWYADDTKLATIYDRSGNNAALFNLVAGTQPLFKIDPASGFPYIRFDGGQYIDILDSVLPEGNSPYSLFFVARSDAGDNKHLFFAGTGTSNRALFVRRASSAGLNTGWWANNLNSSNNVWPADTDLILDTHYDTQGRFQFANGVAAGSDSQTVFNYTHDTTRLGYGTGGGDPFEGRVYEFLLYQQVVSGTYRTLLYYYLGRKWALHF